jgi:glyoxylase-like metal-dependent hydrolase (beta-lactamase superfamily II)
MNRQPTRRQLFSSALQWSAAAVAARYAVPLPALAPAIAQDARVSAPLVDKGFASVRQIAPGAYAIVSDTSKGPQTVCNGGLLAGKDGALVIEGFMSPAGAAFAVETLRGLTKVPVRAALNSHYHFDHSFGNAYYGAQAIPVWAHAGAARLMAERYATLQGQEKSAILAPYDKKVKEAADPAARQRAEGNLGAYTFLVDAVQSTVLALPSLHLDRARLPQPVDLGGVKAVLEAHPGHTPTDIIVRLPEHNLTFAGDLIFNGSYPVTFDADMADWRKVMNTFAGYGKDALFVPGHGQVCGQEGITRQISVMDDLGAQAEKLYIAGVPVSEAVDRYVVPEPFKTLNLFAWTFCIEGAIRNYYMAFRRTRGPARKTP